MKLKDNSTQEIDTALYQLEQRLKSNIRLTDVENSNASTAKINAVDKKLTEEVKDRQSADEKLQDNINKEVADRQEADAAIENAKQDKLIAGNNIQINGNIISATSTDYMAEAPIKVTDGKISLDTVPVNKGGTGVTTQADINKAFIGNLEVGSSDVTDGTEFVSSWASDNGFAETTEGAVNRPYKRKFIKVWNYIKSKISSVLGLTKDNYGGKASTAGNADTVDNYHASQLWRSDGATWNPNANVVMTPSGNGSEWSFDFRNKNGATGSYWQVWDENKNTLLQVNADDGKVSAPYGFVGNLSGKASTAGTADNANNLTAGEALNGNNTITTTNPTKIGAGQIKVHTVYGGNGPATYGNLINIGGSGGFQFFVEWTGSQTEAGQDLIGRIFTRFWRDNQSAWTAWKELAYNTADVTFNTAKASNKMVIPIGAPSQLEDGCIWIER